MRTYYWSVVQNFVPLLVKFHEISVGPALNFVKHLDWSVHCDIYISQFSMIHKFAGSPFCVTIKVEDENIKHHRIPYWLSSGQLVIRRQLNMKPFIQILWAQLPGQSIYSVHILSGPKSNCFKTVSKTLLMLSTVTSSSVTSTTGPCRNTDDNRLDRVWLTFDNSA